MDQLESLSHSVWECKYHVSFIPKCRRRVLYEGLRQHLGEVFRRLAEQKESRVLEGHLMPDHVHMCIAIPPKHPVASVIGFLKGKSAIALARLSGNERNFAGEHFWARDYAVSTVGFELEQADNSELTNKARNARRLARLSQDLACLAHAAGVALGADTF